MSRSHPTCMMRIFVMLALGCFAPLASWAEEVKTSAWNGYERLDFTVAGKAALLVKPKTAAPGKPWIWRTEFFGHEPQADIALLGKGYHVAYIDLQNLQAIK